MKDQKDRVLNYWIVFLLAVLLFLGVIWALA